ncbi:MAG: AraC family transcriptional regulator [Actinomycetota bacterium]
MATISVRDLATLTDGLTPALLASDGDRLVPTGVDGFGVVRSTARSILRATLYHPVICLILQGAKELELGAQRVECAAGQSIVVSHELPLRSRITDASPEVPYLALILELDVGLLRRLVDDIDGLDVREPADPDPTALRVGGAAPALIDAFGRLLSMVDSPVEASALGPLVVHEIHFRLLAADHGAALRRLLNRDSHASRIAKAIDQIRGDLAEPLAIGDLARAVGMSQSSFHEHFKAVTSTTPLQYQKDLRLLEARQLLGLGDRTVTEVALAVGYQSPTQFSREYSRKFGITPSEDRDRIVRVA